MSGTDTWTWATVTQATPLRIKVDGDTTALDATTDNLVGSLAVFDRVRVHLHSDGIIVTGIQGGVVGTTEATSATANTLALRDGSGQLKAADGVADDDVATVGQLDARVPFAQEVGLTVVTGTGSTAVNQTVTFESGLFSVAPIVIVGTTGSDSISLSGTAVSITASSFTLRTYRNDGGTFGGSYSVPWHAVQMASGTAAGGVGG